MSKARFIPVTFLNKGALVSELHSLVIGDSLLIMKKKNNL